MVVFSFSCNGWALKEKHIHQYSNCLQYILMGVLSQISYNIPNIKNPILLEGF